MQGDPQSCRVVRAPTPEEEDARRLRRERPRLVHECTGHLNRIKALLITHGIRALRITDGKWYERLDKMLPAMVGRFRGAEDRDRARMEAGQGGRRASPGGRNRT